MASATSSPVKQEEFHSTRNTTLEFSDATQEASPPRRRDSSHTNNEPQQEQEQENSNDDDGEEPPIKLYKSTRLKGYFTLTLAGSLNYVAAYQSNDVILANAVPATDSQRRYAQAASMTSVILSFAAVLVHMDRWTPFRDLWTKAFRPSALFELCFLLVFVVWWFIATWVQTSIRGIAGDGKGQYNLYFSTWACFLTSVWTLDRWLVAKGMSSFKSFLASWPNRAPGWIAIFLFSFACFLSVLDLFLNWEEASDQSEEAEVLRDLFEDVNDAQWRWLLTSTALTLPFAAAFVLVELFRERKTNNADQNSKPEVEIIVEGVVLGLLVLWWSASVIFATTPGGAASQVGNAYFFTWACTVFVMETSVWWIHDWRKSIHQKIQQQEEEYRRIQQEVLSKAQNHTDGTDNNNKTHSSPDSHPNSPTEESDKHVKFARTRSEEEMEEVDDDTNSLAGDYEGIIPGFIGT